MKGLLKHLAPHRRYGPPGLREWCRQTLSPHVVLDDTLGQVTYVIAVYKGIPT